MKKVIVFGIFILTMFLPILGISAKKQAELAGKASSRWIPGHGSVSICDCPNSKNSCSCLIDEN